ncbi:MAG: hypothetical protein ACI93P_001010 [bacterium]|jgi:hypothetical protein
MVYAALVNFSPILTAPYSKRLLDDSTYLGSYCSCLSSNQSILNFSPVPGSFSSRFDILS